MDPRRWDLAGLLAALESALDRSAKDDAERSRNRRSLYRRPVGEQQEQPSARTGGLTMAQADALLALSE